MQSKLLFALIAGLFTTGAVLAQSSMAPPPAHDRAARAQKTFDEHFVKLDKDGDGYISREEVADNKWFASQFDMIDTNKDGKLSKEEMQAHHKAMHDQHMIKFDEKFKAADKDGDGSLTKTEASAAKMGRIVKNFEQIDADKDGKVTREELRTYMMKKHKRSTASAS